MEHLAKRGIVCPLPVHGTRRRGAAPSVRAACRDHHVPARRLAAACTAGALRPGGCGAGGAARRRPRLRADDGTMRSGPHGWTPLLERSPRAGRRSAGRAWRRNSSGALTGILAAWPRGLPTGHIHADLFPDNVFFLDGRLSGTDRLLLRRHRHPGLRRGGVPERLVLRGGFLLQRHQGDGRCCALTTRSRPLSDAEERAALPVLCRGAAIRFLLTRLYDWLNTPAGAMVTRKDPMEYCAPAALPPGRARRACLWHLSRSRSRLARRPRGGGNLDRWWLQTQSWAWRLGGDPALPRRGEGAVRCRPGDHQQPHGADRGDGGAGGAEAARAAWCCTPTANT